MVDDLAPAEVRIVLTARDLVRVIPAAWQELMQGGQQWTWDQYVATITSPAGRAIPPGRKFWRNNDLLAVAKRWADAVGPDGVTVVTVPPPGAATSLLWNRYCAAVGADPDVVPPDRGAANESLDVASAELLRRLNLRAADSLPTHVYDREVKWFIAKEVLAARSGPDRLQLDGPRTAWAQAEGQRVAQGLHDLGVRVEGDLDELIGSGAVADSVPTPSADEMLDAALDVIAALVGRLGRRDARGAARPGQHEPEPIVAATATARARKFAGRLLRDSYDRTHR